VCGRYANYHSRDEVVRAFGIDRIVETVDPSWNVAPTARIAVVVDDAGPRPDAAVPRRRLRAGRWGLIPRWVAALAGAPLLINARSETLTSKPAFRGAATRRRAIVPASGYYEWQTRAARPKLPYFLAPASGEPLGLAGIYEWWRPASSAKPTGGRDADAAGEAWRLTVAIVTRSASDALGHVHDRMPVVVPTEFQGPWLDPGLTDRCEIDALLAAIPDPELVPRAVSRAVNSVRHDSPDLIRPV
jgi:putative SOS response-associated peptidase YedK